MSHDPINTVQLNHWVQHWQAGDTAAVDDLLRAVVHKLDHLARKMFRGFPALRSWYDTADIVQGSSLRLINSLRTLQPGSTRDFFNLAAANIRRELLDLARHFRGKGTQPLDTQHSHAEPLQVEAPSEAVHELELWCGFHEAIETLPPEEREVVSLMFYHGWTQAQIAELLECDVRTVRRRWQTACRKLTRQLGGKLPAP
jgi:RNA polymerase sigma factor (sigma-70 family)